MNIIDQSCQILASTPRPLRLIERAGRTCYKSEPKRCPRCGGHGRGSKWGGYCHACYGTGTEDGPAFVRRLIEKGHGSVLEHASTTVRFITDRGVTHELVRHRVASYSQESTRYCNYAAGEFGREITVIRPVEFYDRVIGLLDPFERGPSEEEQQTHTWFSLCQEAEHAYMDMVDAGASPQLARSVLPNSLKTEIVMTANLREWRHVFALRCDKAAHPQMRALMLDCLGKIHEEIPVVFDDLVDRFLEEEK